MNRKKFILLSTAGAAALAIPTWYYKFRIPDFNNALTEPGLLSYIWDEETLRQVGSSYRKKYPEENDQRALIRILSGKEAKTTELLVANLQTQIQEDFQNQEMVMIDGWILSVTEARQCALYSFSSPA